MRVLLCVLVLLACSISLLTGFQKTPDRLDALRKPPFIPPKSLPSPYQPPVPIPNFPSARERPLSISADTMDIVGKTIQYRGHVRMTTDSVVVTADELEYDALTKSAKATGNVAIQMRPPGPLVVPLSQ
jgi:lipopolysaccharide assembly outer membrane protein LptD (OstA)